ncbi:MULTISPECIES: hypothetical protein [unclassified Chamaesiphon]|uniref:hypothetical protein n=1 Tax=unclassified Chamaesiphon TaxID=2620921 RepID=UPI00286AB925|nr:MULTISPECIES: hypothetical protein [unclassified Chamaesiphon]
MEFKGGLFEILAKIKATPGMYIGHPSVSNLFVFLAGYKTARRELGIRPNDRELTFYESFNEFIQDRYQIHISNSWAKIIMLNCPDEKQGFDRFFELLAEFEARSKNIQQPQNDLVKL